MPDTNAASGSPSVASFSRTGRCGCSALLLALAAMLWEVHDCEVISVEASSAIKSLQGRAKHAEQTRQSCFARLLAAPAWSSLLRYT